MVALISFLGALCVAMLGYEFFVRRKETALGPVDVNAVWAEPFRQRKKGLGDKLDTVGTAILILDRT